MTGFQRIASLSSLPPGTSREVELNGREIALFNVGGTLYAVSNACPHRSAPICEGLVEGTEVICPYHFARFELRSGRVLEGPAEEGLATFEVRVDGDDVLLRAE